jgi:membrane-associated phospholipid phosphatase
MAFRPASLCALSLCLPLAHPVAAKSASDYLDDGKEYVLAPLHWSSDQWQWAAGAATSVAAAYAFDGRIRQHFADARAAPHGDPHDLRDAAPVIALTLGAFAAGALGRDESTRTGTDMLEAVGLGTLSSFALKMAAGRVRPDATTEHAQWRGGGDSFPSGHVTAAFAAAEVFAEHRPEGEWRWRFLAYSLASATAYGRLQSNMHWASDVVAGAALGIATGRFVAGHEQEKPARVSFWMQPLAHGAMLSFSVNPQLLE